jgi:heme A synthase
MRDFRLVLFTLGVTYLLLLLGGLVHATGSSLACPDWPLCYGQVFPEMVGGVLVEHSHRLVASSVGFLVILLLISLLRRKDDPALKRWGLFGLVLVIFQGVLGGLTVIFRLPIAVSTIHLGTALLFFAWLIFMAYRVRPGVAAALGTVASMATRHKIAWAAGAVYLQIILGALVRHTGSGLACNTDLISCSGSWGLSSGAQWLHMAHRGMAFLTIGVVIAMTIPVLKEARALERPGVRFLAVASHVMVCVQTLLGFLTVASFIATPIVTAHLGLGALLFADLVALFFAMGPMGAVRSSTRTSPLKAMG